MGALAGLHNSASGNGLHAPMRYLNLPHRVAVWIKRVNQDVISARVARLAHRKEHKPILFTCNRRDPHAVELGRLTWAVIQ
jgi:hypothetical protein